MIELYLATTNAGKLRDFNHALAPGYSLVPLPGLAGLPVPEETAATFQGNAEIKAVAYSLAAPGKYVLADDSGLEVEALGGAPGVRSARFAEDEGFALDGTTDARNNACLQARLLAHPLERAARYRCTLALARNGRVEATADGTVEGEMLAQPRGSGGFGYDPLFLLPELGLTMAEIDVQTRQRYSHRARALAALLCELDGRQRELHRRQRVNLFMAVAPVALLAVGLLGFLLTLSLLLYAMKERGEFHGAFSKSRLLLQMAEVMALLCVSVWAVLRSARSRVALLTCGGIALALLGTGVYELFTLVLQSEGGANLRIQAFAFFCAPLLALAAIGLSGTIRSVRSTPQHDIAQT